MSEFIANTQAKKIAMLFPGQGSQSMGMLSDFSEAVVQQTFEEASHVLNYDLWEIVQHNPEGKLNLTEITQPALLTASVALWRLWRVRGGALPCVLAGHSLGEYSALVCSGALSFTDAVKLVAARGKFMQEAVPEGQGAMAAVLGLSFEQLEEICRKAVLTEQDVVSPANLNAPGQIVVAGHSHAVERVMQAAKEAGAKLVKKLEVSVPSHCGLMTSAAEKLSELLQSVSFQTPEIPVIHNVDANSHVNKTEIKSLLSRQLCSPVRWVESIENLLKDFKIELMIECGPGKILSGLNKRMVHSGVSLLSLSEPRLFEEALKHV